MGMEVMSKFDDSTDLDMMNGALRKNTQWTWCLMRERKRRQENSMYALVPMNRTKASALDELEPGILLVAPLTRTFAVASANGKQISISRQQLPITPAYAFIDYRAQAQTIEYCLENIGSPPSGRLMPSNAYAALSCSRGRDNIRLRGSTNDASKRTLVRRGHSAPKAR